MGLKNRELIEEIHESTKKKKNDRWKVVDLFNPIAYPPVVLWDAL